MVNKKLPSQKLLAKLLHYEPTTGKLIWKPRETSMFRDGKKMNRGGYRTAESLCRSWNTRLAGREAFTATMAASHKIGAVNGENFLAHRVIWKLFHGRNPVGIDHINGNGLDNRIANLREATIAENNKNSSIPSHNTSGVVGLSWDKGRNKWEAYISVGDKKVTLGRFTNKDDAIEARKNAEVKFRYHPNHGRSAPS